MSAPTHEKFAIVITAGLWRGADVSIEPPTCTHPVRHFGNHSEAVAYAEALSATESWPVQDRAGGAA